MSDKATSIYFSVFAIIYLIYTAYFVGHGFHWTNVSITILVIVLAIYYYKKTKK